MAHNAVQDYHLNMTKSMRETKNGDKSVPILRLKYQF